MGEWMEFDKFLHETLQEDTVGDGMRILSNTSMEFLQRVPDSTVSIFTIGSTSPAALLYDALDYFDRRSAKVDETLRLIRLSLPEAVEACVDVAGHEFDVSRQRTLLSAAIYGQAFCSNFLRDHIQEMCKILHVLNTVRSPEIGIPLCIQQYKLFTPSVLIGRLINGYQHLLALRISEYLGMNQEVVVMRWTCSKITASLAIPDVTLLEILLDKLKLCKGISYAAVAAHADKNGRRKLAALFVEHEPRSSKQRRPLEFFGTIQARPLARDLFITYACELIAATIGSLRHDILRKHMAAQHDDVSDSDRGLRDTN